MDICTIVVEPPDLRLIHYRKKEVLALISLLEPEWDQPMAFGNNLGDKDTTPSSYMGSFPEVGCCQYHAKNECPPQTTTKEDA